MNTNIIAIVQARMGATRLPNKMMLHLHGYPVIHWIYQRLQQSLLLDNIVFAIPDTVADNILEGYLQSQQAKVYRGSELDVLDRFYQAAIKYKATHIVRVCADNPLICASEVDHLIQFYQSNICDYAYNHIPKNNRYPDGLGAEICSFELLQRLHQQTSKVAHREHLFNFLLDDEHEYTIKTFDPPDAQLAHPELKLDLDTCEDYQKLLRLPLNITMSAADIVQRAKKYL